MKTNKTFENNYIGYDINIISKERMAVNFSLHWHRYIEILTIPEDEIVQHGVEVVINDMPYTMMPGDICIIWPGQLHEIASNPEKCLVGYQFIPDLFSEFSDFDPYRSAMHRIHMLEFDKNPDLLEGLNLHLKQIRELQDKQPRFFHIEKIMHLLEFFMELVNGMVKIQNIEEYKVSEQNEDINWKIQRVCNYISNNASEDIGLNDVAEYIGLSPSYLSRTFKQVTGESFVEFLLSEKIKKAQSLLSNSDMSILDVSFSSGFRSISTFNRVFRQQNGCSPTEYRKYIV